MKPRERVALALNHLEADRCPLQVSFTPEFCRRLGQTLGIAADDYGSGNLAADFVLERKIGCDLLLAAAGSPPSSGWSGQRESPDSCYFDEWGVKWQRGAGETPFGPAHYVRIVGHPLADERALPSFEPPDPLRPGLYHQAERAVKKFKDDYFIVGVVAAAIFETAWALRGLERILNDMRVKPDLAEKLLDIPLTYHLTVASTLVEVGVDMILLADDIAGRERMLISPAMWRRFLKPRLGKLISTLKAINPRLKIAYHSDGAMEAVVDDLIEIGVDVLHPVEPECLDPEKLKRVYGDKLSLWGTIDLLGTPPLKEPAQLEAEVKNRIKTVGKGGGLIIGPTHPVQLATPMENFWAMVNAVHQTFYRQPNRDGDGERG